MNPLRSVGGRLSLALLVVVAGALGIVYAVVVPSLERRLVDAKLSQLERAAPELARQVPLNRFAWPDFLETSAASANTRIVIFDVLGPPTTLTVAGDSRGVSSADVEDDPVALRAALTLRQVHATVTRSGGRMAEVALPLTPRGPVLLLSAPLNDSLESVSQVRQRLLLAGLIALAIALLVGYGGAWIFARRIRRLERAAERIAAGRFDQPVVDQGTDELGELARAFERMRSQLAQLDHARREFIANASHELRTPLFSLGGFLELLADEDLDEGTRREFLGTMREQVERLTKLAIELLDLSRLDAGRLAVEREALDLARLADALVGEFRPVAQAGEHALELDAEKAVAALGDEQRVLQIGRILVENALLHTPAGTTVRVRAETEGGRSVLSVEDDGPGLPPEYAAHVFERFYRLDGAVASGSGLGLAIGQELAVLMGGSIELESERGRTVFTLLLPTALPAETPARKAPVSS